MRHEGATGMDGSKLTTIGEIASELGVPMATLRHWLAKDGLMPTTRIPHTSLARGYTPDEAGRVLRHYESRRRTAVA